MSRFLISRNVKSAFQFSVQNASFKNAIRNSSWWSDVPLGPPDAILGITEAFKRDTSDKKINLGVGAYRGNDGKHHIIKSVKKAEHKIKDLDMEYAPITGVPGFTKLAAELMFGENSAPLKEGRIVSSQAISGTGALRLAFEFLNRFMKKGEAYVPQPTWANHIPIIKDSGLKPVYYSYYNPETCGLSYSQMLSDIKNMPEGSIILLHACAHNPTGVDLSISQWKELSSVFKDKKHFPFFDAAYQGFASGCPNKDAEPIRLFIEDGHQLLVCQSFAKNFGLYGHRVGALHIVTGSKDEANAVASQLKILIRPMYSNPPIHGARLVESILGDKELKTIWHEDVKEMADRIIDMRTRLVQGLKKAGSQKDWSHITNQIGMFCFSGLNKEQVGRLADEFHIYTTFDGRISMAGVTTKNVEYLANAIHQVTK